jgi:hypothetical protein
MISEKGLRTETLATVIQDIILGIIQSRTEENGQRRNWRGHLSVVDAALQSAQKKCPVWALASATAHHTW